MIFIEPDGCFRQVSTTLGLFEGRRTQQTTFIPKRFTKIWSKKPFFTRNCAARTFQNSKLYSCEKRASKWFERKKFAIDKKKVLERKRRFPFFEVVQSFIWRVDGSSGEDIPLLNYYYVVLTYYSWKEPHWQKLVRKLKNRVSVTERKISSEKSAYL